MLNNSASSAWVAWPTHLSAYFYLVLVTALATLSQAVPLAAKDVYPHRGARSNEEDNGNNDKNNENNKNKKSNKEENFFDKEYGGVSGKQIAIIVGVGSVAALIVGVAVWHRRKTNKEKAARRMEEKAYQYENEARQGAWA